MKLRIWHAPDGWWLHCPCCGVNWTLGYYLPTMIAFMDRHIARHRRRNQWAWIVWELARLLRRWSERRWSKGGAL